ncbi:MAG: helix-turn-helix domain-containing protein [Synergistaceae bacterium]|nr:helix-turn-helix domain-containing protein [Synergistaceae bacterium]
MNVQLANTYDPAKNYGVSHWYASPKLDGVRAVFIPEQGLLTRNNKTLSGFNNICRGLEKICSECSLAFIDGELVIKGRSFQASQGVILAPEHPDKTLAEFHVFAVGGNFANTASMLRAIPEDRLHNIFRVESDLIPNTFKAVEEACDKFTKLGFEGVMLRNPERAYFYGRNDDLLKYKFFNEADLEIVEVREKSVTVQGKIGDIPVRSKVKFSGEDLTGKVLSVKYQSITERADKDGFYSLRFPSAIGIKEDREAAVPEVKAKSESKSKSKSENKAKGLAYYKNGIVEAVFNVDLIYRRKKAASNSEMSVWKDKLFRCRSIQEGRDLIAELKLTIPKIMEFAKYLGVRLKGCKYLKSEIVRWVVNGSLGAKLRAEKWLKFISERSINKMTKSEIFAQIRALRQSASDMNQKINQLEDLISRLSEPYPEVNQGKDKDEWLTAKETCKALKISMTTFYRLIQDGSLPEGFEFSPRSKRWRLSDIEAWQKAKKDKPQEIPQIVQSQRRTRSSKVKKYWELQHVSA